MYRHLHNGNDPKTGCLDRKCTVQLKTDCEKCQRELTWKSLIPMTHNFYSSLPLFNFRKILVNFCRILKRFFDFRDFSDLKVKVSKIMSNRLSGRPLIGWAKSCSELKYNLPRWNDSFLTILSKEIFLGEKVIFSIKEKILKRRILWRRKFSIYTVIMAHKSRFYKDLDDEGRKGFQF